MDLVFTGIAAALVVAFVAYRKYRSEKTEPFVCRRPSCVRETKAPDGYCENCENGSDLR